VLAAALLLILFLGPADAAFGASSGPSASAVHVASSDGTVTARVTFNGQSIDGHASPSDAIVANFHQLFKTVMNWSSTGGSAEVTQGTLTLLFAGISIGTSSQSIVGATPRTGGTVTLNNTSFAQDQYLFEGVYELQASLFDNGALLFQQTFYVWIQATYHLTIVNIALLVIAIWECYAIASLASVRAARKELGLTAPSQSSPPPASPPTPPPGGT
jgi:hypothetical protein